MRINALLLLCAAMLTAGPVAKASVVGLDQWNQFVFDANGGMGQSCQSTIEFCLSVPNTVQVGLPEWTLAGPAPFDVTLIVTDAFQLFDLLEITSNGQTIASQAPPLAGNNVAAATCDLLDLMSCVLDPNHFSRMVTFAAGSTVSFNFRVSQQTPIEGTAFFILLGEDVSTTPVPEPASGALFAVGLTLAAVWKRRRRAG